jgi:hypothetical protein
VTDFLSYRKTSGIYDKLKKLGMAHLDCETWLRLWAYYGRALRLPSTNRTPEAILNEIKAHEAVAHQNKRSEEAGEPEVA